MASNLSSRQRRESIGWGFAVLAAILVIIFIGWGWSGQGRGWGRNNQMAHMTPPAVNADNGPATRSNSASGPIGH